MGCDMKQGGCKGVGSTNVSQACEESDQDTTITIDDKLINLTMKKIVTDESVAEAYLQAIARKPIDERSAEGEPSTKCTWIDDEPKELHHCEKDFIHASKNGCAVINDKVEIFKYEGHDQMLPHDCLACEKIICSSCGLEHCLHCVKDDNNDNKLCMSCCKEKNMTWRNRIWTTKIS